ncbi:hypothetical protein Q5741_03755 [Paenibacillus sp. JX-17]|uniref:Uncharacterized protein n=1 Tax=Paenibacillus lacisoli TaxID=3064525 RepID=A0ABT9C8F7_9BACL|nr:hypothetical protein [Paenibacillus sp. JX-17]MDO7905524.1 hypothetical protein [Paenibacillus sp. JX-17]
MESVTVGYKVNEAIGSQRVIWSEDKSMQMEIEADFSNFDAVRDEAETKISEEENIPPKEIKILNLERVSG